MQGLAKTVHYKLFHYGEVVPIANELQTATLVLHCSVKKKDQISKDLQIKD